MFDARISSVIASDFKPRFHNGVFFGWGRRSAVFPLLCPKRDKQTRSVTGKVTLSHYNKIARPFFFTLQGTTA